MQTADHAGVICDLCGTEQRARFTYYSLTLRRARRVAPQAPSVEAARRERPESGLDLCPACYATLADRVVRNYRPVAGGLACDLTGAALTGDFTYWYGEVTKAEVDVDARPRVAASERHLELAIGPAARRELTDAAAATKRRLG